MQQQTASSSGTALLAAYAQQEILLAVRTRQAQAQLPRNDNQQESGGSNNTTSIVSARAVNAQGESYTVTIVPYSNAQLDSDQQDSEKSSSSQPSSPSVLYTYNTGENIPQDVRAFARTVWSVDDFRAAWAAGAQRILFDDQQQQQQYSQNFFYTISANNDIITLLKTCQGTDLEKRALHLGEVRKVMLVHLDAQNIDFIGVHFDATAVTANAPPLVQKLGRLALSVSSVYDSLKIITYSAYAQRNVPEPTLQQVFDDAMQRGTSTNCDLTVKDIYGPKNCAVIGLSEDLIASQLGKVENSPDLYQPYDVARSFVNTLAMEIAQVGSLIANQHALTVGVMVTEAFDCALFDVLLTKLFNYYSGQKLDLYVAKQPFAVALLGAAVREV